MKAMILAVLALGAALVPSTGGRAVAQAHFTERSLGVLNARQVVREQNGYPVWEGSQVILTVLPAARPRLASGVQMRIFALARGWQWPTPRRFADSCFIFHSTVLEPRVSPDLLMNLGTFSGLGYLTVEQGTVSDGRFLIVFEESGDSNRMIRLHKNHFARYFASGLYLEIRRGQQYGMAEITRRMNEIRVQQGMLVAEARIDGPRRNCYRYRAAQLRAGEDLQLAFFGDCTLPPAPTGPHAP